MVIDVTTAIPMRYMLGLAWPCLLMLMNGKHANRLNSNTRHPFIIILTREAYRCLMGKMCGQE